jgi:hypothetical protein
MLEYQIRRIAYKFASKLEVDTIKPLNVIEENLLFCSQKAAILKTAIMKRSSFTFPEPKEAKVRHLKVSSNLFNILATSES